VGKESEEDKGGPDEQTIALSNLPEAIASRYLETKREMESIMNDAQGELDAIKRAKTDIADEEEFETTTTSGFQAAIKDQPASEAGTQDDMNSVDSAQDAANLQEELQGTVVKRVQMQRMLDDDPVLVEICGTSRAIEIMRRFRVDAGSIDPYAAVAQLQANVAKKLKEIEESGHGHKLDFDELETLRTVSQELHSALTDSQKEWRQELLSVLQMATLLSVALKSLTERMELIQLHHRELASKAGPGH
jgi:hypothetical protein